jgi:hypothetical protein
LVRQSGGNCGSLLTSIHVNKDGRFDRGEGAYSSLLTGIPGSHLHRVIIPDDVLIQFDLLMMSTVMLETCREMR